MDIPCSIKGKKNYCGMAAAYGIATKKSLTMLTPQANPVGTKPRARKFCYYRLLAVSSR